MRLRKFKKEAKRNRKKILISLIVILSILTSILINRTYAFFQKENEVTFINAKVRWPKASEVTYTTTYNTSVKNVEQALNDLYGKLGE